MTLNHHSIPALSIHQLVEAEQLHYEFSTNKHKYDTNMICHSNIEISEKIVTEDFIDPTHLINVSLISIAHIVAYYRTLRSMSEWLIIINLKHQ